MPAHGTRKCLNCQSFFKPDPRTKGKQKYCSNSSCRKASRKAKQKKWLLKPQNKDYFKGPENVQRVRQWRAKHPGYWRKQFRCDYSDDALQDQLMMQTTDNKRKTSDLNRHALQDLLSAQDVVLIGLIAHLTGTALQDDIVNTTLKLQQLGEDLLHPAQPNRGEYDGTPNLTQSGTLPGNSQTVQLGRSPPGT